MIASAVVAHIRLRLLRDFFEMAQIAASPRLKLTSLRRSASARLHRQIELTSLRRLSNRSTVAIQLTPARS